TAIDQLIRPVVLLVRLLRLEAIRTLDPAAAVALGDALEPVLARGSDVERIAAAVERGERACPDHPFRFDAIGLCFPDVVVR
ncbi:hypothetical protein NL533_34715, partial [Klebsiella pneumoniae]|nr:hypothetical protein [Klebsiella pneumoniae]